MRDRRALEKLEAMVVFTQYWSSGKGWWMVLSRHTQGFMAQMKTMREVTCGMSWSVFSSTREYRGVALEILILYIFQVNVWVGHV